MITLRDDQQTAIANLRNAYAEGRRRIVMQAPTGFGKTILAGALVRRALELGNRIIFTVPAISLIDQTVESLRSQGISEIGVIQQKHPLTDPSRPVQVASVSTLARRPLPEADVVLIDEVHRWYDFYETWMQKPEWADVPFIGLSATPWTKGLAKWFEQLTVASTTAQCIEAGTLSPFKVFAPSHPDLSRVRTVAGDYHEGDLSQVMSRAALVADVVKTWQAKAENRPTLCFAVDCAHARLLTEQFCAAGISCAYQDANTPDKERADIKRKFHSGELKVVCNIGTLTTGVDWDVRCLILARPTKSEILFVQIIGRALRTAPGKDYAMILDHSDTHLRLGFVTDIHHEELLAEKQKRAPNSPPMPKECPVCQHLVPPGTMTCDACGHEWPRKFVTDVGGELAELKARVPTTELGNHLRKQSRVSVYSQLRSIAQDRGYKSGWVAHKFKEIFGSWPGFYGDDEDETPSEELLRFVKQQAKIWAQSQEQREPRPAPQWQDFGGRFR